MTKGLNGPRLAVLGALTALGSLGTHMVVPSLPAIAADLHASAATVQLAVSIYLLGLGIGQLASGAISDALGRGIVLKAGIAAFAIGALLATLATRAEPFLAARLLQALGGSAALIACRAIVAEQTLPGEVASGLAGLSAITLLSPAVAPTIGGLVAAAAGWRAVFVVLTVGATLGLFAAFRIVRALPARAVASGSRELWAGYAALLCNPGFFLQAGGNALVSAAFYSFLACSPFTLIEHYRLTPGSAGLCYFAVAIAIIAGTLFVAPIERRFPGRLSGGGRLGLSLGAAALFAVAWWPGAPVAAFVGAMVLLAFGSGLTGPAALAAAFGAAGPVVGSAAALFGATQMLVAAAVSAIVAHVAHAQSAALEAIALIACLAVATFTLAERASRAGLSRTEAAAA